MPDKETKKRRRRRDRRSILYVPIALLLTFVAILFGLSFFFKVADIQVSGAVIYSPEQVKEASGIESGDNLFLVSQATTVAKICAALPYVAEVKVYRVLPSTIKIEISESFPVAYIQADSDCWIIDKDGKLLEKTTAAGVSGKIAIKGMALVNPEIGRSAGLNAASPIQFQYLTKLLNLMMNKNLQSKITYLDVTSIANISFDYDQRFTVKLGSAENAEEKIALLLDVINNRLKQNDKGTINLATDKQADFSPS